MLEKVNYYWRLFATATVYTIFGLGCILVPLFSLLPFLLIRNHNIRQRGTRKLVHWAFKGYIHLLKFMGIMEWEVQGIKKLKNPGILVVSNHPTLLDVVFLIAFMPNADCIIKSALLKNPIMIAVVYLSGYIKNDSGALLIKDAKKSLNRGNSLIIFAEGTRTNPDEEISFLRGAANIIVRIKKVPTPVIIKCSPWTLGKKKKWYDIPSRKFKLTIKVLAEMDLNRFLVMPPGIGARRLTKHMEKFFKNEIALIE